MNHQASRTLQQTETQLAPAEVLAAAKRFFARRNSIYSAYIEKEGPTYVNLRGMGGTIVNGSSYLFDQQIARFFATLPPFEQSAGEPADGAAR